jgi:hypothetical protein
MAHPFRPLTTEALKKISKYIKNPIRAVKNSEQRFVLSSRKIKPESKIKSQSLNKIHSNPRTHNHY